MQKDFENDILELRQAIEKINARNSKVEIDKGWEISKTRRIILVIFTYLSVALYLLYIKVERPWLNAIVPAVGFTLSTLSLPFFKQIWAKYFAKK